jgi:drug/metabolite transporter (DMT)-like permease
MQSASLCRVGAVCAMLAGISRTALIIAPGMGLGHPALETIYLAIDVAIQLALLALLTQLGNRLSLWGVAGVIMATTGLLVIRTGERSLFGAAAYSSGAGLLAIGMAVTTFPFIRVQGLGRLMAILFMMSPATAIIATALNIESTGSNIASALFSLALITAGAMLMFEENPRKSGNTCAS